MTGVARRTSPRAGFLGSSTGRILRGLGLEFEEELGVTIELVFRETGAAGVFFAVAETTGAGALTEAEVGDELAAATGTSGYETGFAVRGGSAAASAGASCDADARPSCISDNAVA